MEASEGEEAYFDPSKANMLKLKKEKAKNRKPAAWDVEGTTPRGAQSLGNLMKVALYRKFLHYAKMGVPNDPTSVDLLEEEGKTGESSEKKIKTAHLLDLVKDCGEKGMPPQQIATGEDGTITWTAFLTWWQLGQQHLEDVYSDEEEEGEGEE